MSTLYDTTPLIILIDKPLVPTPTFINRGWHSPPPITTAIDGSRLPLAAGPPGHGAAQGHRAQGAAALRAVAATAVAVKRGTGSGVRQWMGWE